MPEYTNVNNLPQWLVDKLVPKDKTPNPKRMSVTDLIHPPRMRTLKLERYDEITQDVSELLAFFDGNNLDEAFKEDKGEQIKMELPIGGITLVGVMDRLEENTILDRKRCKVGGKEYPSTLKEWECQLNVYSYMRNVLEGKRVDRLENHLFYKDWTPVRTSDPSYPQAGYEIIVQPHWLVEEQEQYIHTQLEYHSTKPMDCPKSERWSSFAIKSKGRKTAHRVLKSIQACEDWMNKNKKGDYIEDRDCLRCKFFCSVRSVCKNSPVFWRKKDV